MLNTMSDSPEAIVDRVETLLARMTLAEKIGQMTQAEKGSISPEDVTELGIGSVLSGGGGAPDENSPAAWLEMVRGYQQAAVRTRLAIPLIYGVDSVHGHGNVRGATVFPHNIGLGASRDADLVRRIAQATAIETAATGIRWNFAPTIAVPQDLRWGRTYEGFGERPALVAELGEAYVQGAQGAALSPESYNLATAKHYLADGGTRWGTSNKVFPAAPLQNVTEPWDYFIDQGDARMDEDTLRRVHLTPYVAAIKAGAQCVMASFSSWNGRKMHGHYYLLTQVLKEELDFTGFIVSDWGGMNQITNDYYQAIVQSVNAGVDMNMVPFDFRLFIETLTRAAAGGDVSEARIDDAVRRILTVKFRLGLFAEPVADNRLIPHVGSRAHRELAREAVAKSLVLLKNQDDLLPLPRAVASLHVAGQWADDIGLQCGGWTIAWLGQPGNVTPGTTILGGIRAAVAPDTQVQYAADGMFQRPAEVGIVVVGEMPYAEGFGDRADLTLPTEDVALIERVRGMCDRLIVIVVSGRPLILTEQLPLMDALVAAWLPGSEGQEVADVLFGERPFTGKLPYSWPRSMAQVPLANIKPDESGKEALFPFGFGLK